ncbi:DUF4157 domain-containing protein [Streptomyces sp. NPDC059916]|uniref:eCIS core domain-containing protein n=1 Tax=Streptomyces sp. NPDC059916 TaxID=3347001 RepID=UPI0036C521ED
MPASFVPALRPVVRLHATGETTAGPLPPAALFHDIGGGEPLRPEVAGPLRERLSVDVSPVRVHTGGPAGTAVAKTGARALAWGNHVLLGKGESPADLALMAHEVAHVVQQSAAPAVRLFGGPHSEHEHEAYAVSSAVVRGESAAVHCRTTGSTVQGLFESVGAGLKSIGSAVGAATALGKGALDAAVDFVRARAASMPGYDLLAFVLGRDPVTQKTVDRTAGSLVHAVAGLIPGGPKLLADLEQTKVVQKSGDWIATELPKLGLSWTYVHGLFAQVWKSLDVSDLLIPARAWEKLRAVFGPPLTRVRDFAVGAARKLLEFLLEGALALGGSAAQQVLAVLRRVGAVFGLISADPVTFLSNLLGAVKGGFKAFASNILSHLRTGLFEWLLGAMKGALVLPSRFDFAGILSIVLQVLGLTYSALRGMLVKLITEPGVAFVEKAFDFLVLLVTKGLPAAWGKIKEFATGLAESIVEGIRDWVARSVVVAAITKLVTMFNPVGALVQAVIGIYNTVMFFIERAQQIARLLNTVLDSIETIARGNLSAAAQFVERTMAQTLPVIIAFLARLTGLGNVTEYVRNIIKKVQATISNALLKVARWIADRVKGLLGGRGTPTGAPEDKSALVRQQAAQRLQQVTVNGATLEQVEQEARRTAAALHPSGLERLEVGPADEEGNAVLSASASALKPFARFMLPRGAAPAGRSVKALVQLKLSQPSAVLPRNLAPVDDRTPLPTGGVVLPQPAATTVRVVTWNTSNIYTYGNNSHAEHQLVAWLESTEGKALMPYVDRIELDLRSLSPCSACSDELTAVLKEIAARRKREFQGSGDAVLSWSRLYLGTRPSGDNRTTNQSINTLHGAGWTLHAPPDALPTDQTVWTELAKGKVSPLSSR